MEAFVEVVDNIPVINLRNGMAIIEVPLDVVAEGLVKLLDDAGSTGRRHCRDLASC